MSDDKKAEEKPSEENPFEVVNVVGLPEGFKADMKMPCEFCGKELQADSERGELLHALPACETFLSDIDPAEFLALMRKRRLTRLSAN